VTTTITRDLTGRATLIAHTGRGVTASSLPSGVVNPSSMAPGNAYGHCNASPSGHPNQQPAGCDTGTLAFAYTYDPRGLVERREIRTDETTTATGYAHDGLGRLVSSTTGAYVATYGWDAASNLVTETVSDDLSTNLADDGHVVVREVNEVNQATSIVTDFGQYPVVHTTTVALVYDLRGNRTGETTTRTTGGTTHVLNQVTYTFDGADQLVGTHDTGDNQNNAKDDQVTTWSRDGMGRPLVVTTNGVSVTRVFDGLDVVVDGSTRVTRGPTTSSPGAARPS
jgi:YD repeat-containing protein